MIQYDVAAIDTDKRENSWNTCVSPIERISLLAHTCTILWIVASIQVGIGRGVRDINRRPPPPSSKLTAPLLLSFSYHCCCCCCCCLKIEICRELACPASSELFELLLTRRLRWALCVEQDPPIEAAIAAGSVPACMRLLQEGSRSVELTVEALWVLTVSGKMHTPDPPIHLPACLPACLLTVQYLYAPAPAH